LVEHQNSIVLKALFSGKLNWVLFLTGPIQFLLNPQEAILADYSILEIIIPAINFHWPTFLEGNQISSLFLIGKVR